MNVVGFDDEGLDVVCIPKPGSRMVKLLQRLFVAWVDLPYSIMHVVTSRISTVSLCMSFHPDPLSVDVNSDFLI